MGNIGIKWISLPVILPKVKENSIKEAV